MELSSEVYDLLERFKTLPKHNGEPCSRERIDRNVPKTGDEIIHVDEMQFSDDETWLYKPSNEQSGSIHDLHNFLQNGTAENIDRPLISHNTSSNSNSPSRFIDSRTFTRPKKRYSRPSIEKYNEELFDLNTTENNASLIAAKLQEMELSHDDSAKPLNFDLSQPTSTSIFDKIFADAPMMDSFQNMSPPSLVNSMCSSTFTTLMENSFIKNDPVLREIRDTDYSETVLLQDGDPPMFQSFTDNFCTDKTDSFIKKALQTTNTNFNEEFEENERTCLKESDSSSSLLENLSCRISTDDSSRSDVASDELHFDSTFTRKQEIAYNKNHTDSIIISTPASNLNGTYKKGSKLYNAAKNTMIFSTDSLDDKEQVITMNETFSLDKRMSLNDERILKMNETYNSANLKRNSAGSADSLDRMSSLSNTSSRGSSRMLNMAEVDAIVERQEQSLQVISTPKPSTNYKKILCDTLLLSPIGTTLERSDSDLSSSDDYVTGRTSLSKASSPANSDSGAVNYTIKSVKSANAVLQANPKHPVRSINTITKNMRPLQAAGSYTSLQNLKGSQTNLQQIGGGYKGSQSSLRGVNPQLRGSYTSLKPVNKNLPEAPPPLNSTQVYSSQNEMNRTVKLTRNETFKVPLPVGDAQNLPVIDAIPKPYARSSNLPRPVNTGIPRPVSKIPGPRVVKSATSQPNLKQTRHINDASYY